MQNHGGSPPILGLKEATLELGGKKAQMVAHLYIHISYKTITTQLNTTQYNPSKGFHIDSTIESRYTMKVGSLHEENFKFMSHIYSHLLISNMLFQGFTMSSLLIHLLIPPKHASNREVHSPLKHIKIISTHGRVS